MTEQYILGKTDHMSYLKEVEFIGDHIGRICECCEVDLNVLDCTSSSVSKHSNNSTNLKIEPVKE